MPRRQRTTPCEIARTIVKPESGASLFATDVRTASANLLSRRSQRAMIGSDRIVGRIGRAAWNGLAPVRQLHHLPRGDRGVRARHERCRVAAPESTAKPINPARIGAPVGALVRASTTACRAERLAGGADGNAGKDRLIRFSIVNAFLAEPGTASRAPANPAAGLRNGHNV
jgi:hypothetical protein